MESRNIQDPGEAEHSWDTELVGRRLEEGLLPAREWYDQKIGKEGCRAQRKGVWGQDVLPAAFLTFLINLSRMTWMGGI